MSHLKVAVTPWGLWIRGWKPLVRRRVGNDGWGVLGLSPVTSPTRVAWHCVLPLLLLAATSALLPGCLWPLCGTITSLTISLKCYENRLGSKLGGFFLWTWVANVTSVYKGNGRAGKPLHQIMGRGEGKRKKHKNFLPSGENCGIFYFLDQRSALQIPVLIYDWMELLKITGNILKMMVCIIMDKINSSLI